MEPNDIEISGIRVLRDHAGYERVVMGEVLIPDTPNTYGDIYTPDAIREFVYAFAKRGYIIDHEHDLEDISDKGIYVVESFIARPGDPDFIAGSWVVAMRIEDDEMWAKVLNNEINGYSFEALCMMQEIVFQNLRDRQVIGDTDPDPVDGHTHTYLLILDSANTVISGSTGVTNGHSHRITRHTVTMIENGHRHRIQVNPVEES